MTKTNSVNLDTLEIIEEGPAKAGATFILAHGAGQGMDAPFMATMADAIREADSKLRVVRFNFPYMTRASPENRRRPPDRESTLLDSFRAVIGRYSSPRLFIGGKSMGGRMASLIADEVGVDGLVCLGYPFHPPGRPEKLRTAHLEDLKTPALVCQGSRDAFGKLEEVSKYILSDSIFIHWLEDGDHGFKPRKSSGRSLEQNLAEAAGAVVDFIHRRVAK